MYEPAKYYDYAQVKLSRGEADGEAELFFILKKYGIKAAKITSHENVYRVFDQNSSYALKKVETDPEKLLFFLSAMDYLWQRGFHSMSRLLRSDEGELYVSHGGERYFLTQWIEGDYIDFSQEDQLTSAVHLLADMHRRGEGFEPPKGCVPRNDIGRWPKKWRQRMDDLEKMAELSTGQKDEFDRVFHKIVKLSLEEAGLALKEIEEAGYGEYCLGQREMKPLCHRDFVYHNLIFDGSQVFLIDFEYCVQDFRVIDLARLIRTTFIHHPWEGETVRKMIAAYQEKYPLSCTEQRMLLALLQFPHDIWRTGHKWYFAEQKKKSYYHLLCRQCQFYHDKYLLLEKLEQGFLAL